MFQDQRLNLELDYQDQLDGLTNRLHNMDDELITKYRNLQEDFDRISLEYDSLERRYQDYDDRCDYNQERLFQDILHEQQQKQMKLEEQKRLYQEQLYRESEPGYNEQNSYNNPYYNHLSSYKDNSTTKCEYTLHLLNLL